MHEQHRQRVRRRLMREGLDAFEEHQVLELLLFYAIPRQDTNDTAHRLIEAFGSLNAVLDAAPEDLVKVKGIGENAAVLLHLLPQLARRYTQDAAEKTLTLRDADALRDYVLAKFVGHTSEQVFLLSLTAAGKLSHCAALAAGSMNAVQLDARHLLQTALRSSAASVILAHNHPGGIAVPSHNDVEATRQAANLFSAVGIRLADHMIVAGSEVFSMAATEKFRGLFV